MNVIERLATLLAMKPEPPKVPLTYPSEWLLDLFNGYPPRTSEAVLTAQSLREYGYQSINEVRESRGLRPLTEKANAYLSLHEHTVSAGCKGCGASQWKGSTCAYCGRQS